MGHPKDPEDWLLKRNRDGDTHRDNCGNKGYTGDSIYSNIHHIVCISCMADGTIEMKVGGNAKRFEFIQDCLALTDWDINAKANVIGLPKKQAYVDKLAPANWGKFPCHQVDHPGYLERVSASLNTNIWAILQKVAKDCTVGGEVIATQLKAESKSWEGTLRGRKAAAAWATKKDNPDTWYIEFSMNKAAPSKRKPPPDWTENFTSGMVSKLSELFAMVV